MFSPCRRALSGGALLKARSTDAYLALYDEHGKDGGGRGFGQAQSLADLSRRGVAAGQALEDGGIDLIP
jgi:hypothetical protein